MQVRHPPERRSETGAVPCVGIALIGRRNLRGAGRRPVRAFKEMSGPPTFALDTYNRDERGIAYGTRVLWRRRPRSSRRSHDLPRRAGKPATGRRGPGDRTPDDREVCVMQNAETVVGVLRERHGASTRRSLESPLPGNWHGGFGPGAAGKGPESGTSPAAYRCEAAGTAGSITDRDDQAAIAAHRDERWADPAGAEPHRGRSGPGRGQRGLRDVRPRPGQAIVYRSHSALDIVVLRGAVLLGCGDGWLLTMIGVWFRWRLTSPGSWRWRVRCARPRMSKGG